MWYGTRTRRKRFWTGFGDGLMAAKTHQPQPGPTLNIGQIRDLVAWPIRARILVKSLIFQPQIDPDCSFPVTSRLHESSGCGGCQDEGNLANKKNKADTTVNTRSG
jgi:hypothetical protein